LLVIITAKSVQLVMSEIYPFRKTTSIYAPILQKREKHVTLAQMYYAAFSRHLTTSKSVNLHIDRTAKAFF